MMIHEITEAAGKYKARKRLGRGDSSGHGGTCGRGHKGAKARSGHASRRGFEGGQMPYFRRIAKRGFTNVQFKTVFRIANLGAILAHPDFAKGGEINAARLVAAGLIPDNGQPLKILGDMGDAKSLKVKCTVNADRVTDSVRKLITDAGGSVEESGTRRDQVRGVDRNSDDRRPKNLGKKPKRRAAKRFDQPKPQGKKKQQVEEAPAAE